LQDLRGGRGWGAGCQNKKRNFFTLETSHRDKGEKGREAGGVEKRARKGAVGGPPREREKAVLSSANGRFPRKRLNKEKRTENEAKFHKEGKKDRKDQDARPGGRGRKHNGNSLNEIKIIKQRLKKKQTGSLLITERRPL